MILRRWQCIVLITNISIFARFLLIAATNVPVYWINMDGMTDRQVSMTKHLDNYGVKYHKRIRALTPKTCNLIMVDSNCNRVSLSDIAIACSHVSALHTALNDQSDTAKRSKYFVVLEDDVRFKFGVDFEKFIGSAPEDFGSLQLMMSHKGQIETAWSHYTNSMHTSSPTRRPDYFIHRPRNSTVWSAQAVLYNKEVIRQFVEKAVVKDKHGQLGYKLVTTADYDKSDPAKINGFKPAIACSCLFADMFVYAVAQPAFIATVPMFNSAVQGVNSTYHQAHVVYHLQGFAQIQQIQDDMARNAALLPPYLTPLPVGGNLKGSSIEKPVDWIEVAKQNPAKGLGVPRRFNDE